MWVEHATLMRKLRYANEELVGKPERKVPLGRPRCRREDTIKVYIKDCGGGCELD
jgi:hypothetical protein